MINHYQAVGNLVFQCLVLPSNSANLLENLEQENVLCFCLINEWKNELIIKLLFVIYLLMMRLFDNSTN